MYRFEVQDRPLLVVRLGDLFYVSDSICTHEEADLSLGMLMGDVVTCPLHRAKFELGSGKVLQGPDGSDPATIPPLKTFSTKVEDGKLFADI